jgi:hypothetical protein
MPKSYRIRTQVGVDKYINVNLEQDWESLEVLSLKILASDVYTRMCADYGVVVGRVFVNNGFGLPNAKVSVFIPLDPADELDPVISELYPYKTITDTNEDGYRYNLLPKLPSYKGHNSTGSFPNVADSLMDDNYIEVYDKYYRFTVKTNESGDFMLFGVPTGTQTIVMDVDLSDIGCFSLSPQDLIQSGLATESQVNGSTFKSSTNLRELPQIKNLVFDVNVSPFWGDDDLCQVGITRVDFDLTKQANINIEPTAIFMGSIISTTDDDALKVKCKPKNDTGNLCELISGPGEIQAIRQTINTDDKGYPVLEQYQIEEGGKVIDGDGTYLINVPMNLDYVFTNEFGEQVLSDDPSKGIPTKGKYRFKFKWRNDEGLQNSFQRANFLVPNVKEYGWNSSSNDPFESSTGVFDYSIPAGQTSGSTFIQPYTFDVGLSLENDPTNTSSFIVYLNDVPYGGTLNSIPFNVGDTIRIIGTANNTTLDQDFQFTVYPKQLFDVLKSYAFSLDWDDYVNPQEAINCEDTFYEFNYNKVYTTAMFLDRYKNGIGRARHLGIKEIDNRSCKSTVNTFPVNDIIRNFDFIFFLFNILINILTFPILVLLFVAHLIALLWPIIKVLLLFLGPFIVYQGVSAGIDLAYYVLSLTNFNIGGPVISVGTVLQIIAQSAKVLILVAAGIWFTNWYSKFFIDSLDNGRVSNFPRIGLPMIAYDDCTSCDCDCGNATLDDDVTASTIQQEQQAIQNELNTENGGLDYELTVSQPNSVIAPVNSPSSYSVEHPNLTNNDDGDAIFGDCDSLQNLIGDEVITSDVAVRGALDFARMISGYDVLSSTDPYSYLPDDSYLLHAPQPFLWSAAKDLDPIFNQPDFRYFAYPNSVTFSQKLNDFNTRDKYFYSNTSNTPNTGVNKIKTYINPSVNSGPNQYIEDQVVVILMNAGTIGSIGAGGICTFQDPNFTATTTPNRYINLTGATINQFSNNAITGSTLTGDIPITITYADPLNPSNGIPKTFVITSPPVSQLPIGMSNAEQSYLQYPTDMEYFQLVTGITAGDLYSISTTTSGFFPETYLGHDMLYLTPNNCNNIPLPFIQRSVPNVIQRIGDWENLEVCIFVRGVDPFTVRQTIKYDLSTIFGNPSNPVIVEGQYCLNQPIQPIPTIPLKPLSHDTANNTTPNLYFPSFTFTPDPTQYTAFTSTLPYYYLSTDESPLSSSYNPTLPFAGWNTNLTSTSGSQQATLLNGQSITPTTSYMVGGSYIRWGNNTNAPSFPPFLLTNNAPQDNQKTQYYNASSPSFIAAGGSLTALYSTAYYRQLSTTGVTFSDSSRIIMRSDRIPTSTTVQNGTAPQTGYGLHQNDNFAVYTLNGVLSLPTLIAGGDLANGANFDNDSITSGLTSTLGCEGMVPLECYTGSGSNVGVVPAGQCSVPANRMINGCYCLLNRKYVKEYGADARLFLEWKVRFTMNFAACRGVFAQVFQNNWLNGSLYMFNFNKTTTFGTNSTDPQYNYCNDVIIYNDLTNGFYYRSSPWNGTDFIGKNSPATPTLVNLLKFPGLGYNLKQIQFPTTVTDLGPRDSFINEICCSGDEGGFGSYYANQLKTTSYQDNSDIIQLGFLSRILNQGVRQRIVPISVGGSSSEGQGIIQFFNSERGGYRIDGDWAQMLSINSEWKVLPFITENVPSNDYIFFGDNGSSIPENIKPVMGLFFQTPEESVRYRKIESPGIETYSFNPLIEQKFAYPKTQVVPNYKWSLKQSTPSSNIFGTENNNWYTNTIGNGFFSKKYQDLDFTTLGEKYITQTTKLGYISNYDSNGNPVAQPPMSAIIQGQPIGDPASMASGTGEQQAIIAGAPYHFYFGLNNGKTAVDRFYKLYVSTAEEI